MMLGLSFSLASDVNGRSNKMVGVTNQSEECFNFETSTINQGINWYMKQPITCCFPVADDTLVVVVFLLLFSGLPFFHQLNGCLNPQITRLLWSVKGYFKIVTTAPALTGQIDKKITVCALSVTGFASRCCVSMLYYAMYAGVEGNLFLIGIGYEPLTRRATKVI